MDNYSRSQRPRYWVVIAIVVIFAVAACLITYWATKDTPETESITFGNIRRTLQVKAFFVRDEEYLTMPHEGYMISDLKEGEKAAAGEPLFKAVEKDSYPLIERINELDRDIFAALTSADSGQAVSSEKSSVLNRAITDSVSRMISSVSVGSYGDLSVSAGSIRDALSDKYDEYIKLCDTSAGELSGLITARDSYTASLNAHTHSVSVGAPCTVSFNTFSGDKLIEYSEVQKISARYLDEYTTKNTSDNNKDVMPADRKVARAVYGFQYYIVFNVTEEQYNDMFYVRDYKLTKDDLVIPCELVEIKDCRAECGKYCVILSTRYGLSETIGRVSDDMQLVISDSEGLKVRRSSIFNYNSTTGDGSIYILSKIGAAEKREVRVIAQDNYFAIIEELPNKYDDKIQVYDEIVVNPSSTEEGLISR